jgi:hypothetical protein
MKFEKTPLYIKEKEEEKKEKEKEEMNCNDSQDDNDMTQKIQEEELPVGHSS